MVGGIWPMDLKFDTCGLQSGNKRNSSTDQKIFSCSNFMWGYSQIQNIYFIVILFFPDSLIFNKTYCMNFCLSTFFTACQLKKNNKKNRLLPLLWKSYRPRHQVQSCLIQELKRNCLIKMLIVAWPKTPQEDHQLPDTKSSLWWPCRIMSVTGDHQTTTCTQKASRQAQYIDNNQV